MFTRWISRNGQRRALVLTAASILLAGWPRTAAAQVGPELTGFEFAQGILAGCKTTKAEIRLSQPAPAGGVVVSLGSDSPLIALPSAITIKAGTSGRQVNVVTAPVTAETIVVARATLAGRTLYASVRLRPVGVATLTLSRKSVPGGQPVQATATLECAAPGPIEVELTSDNPKAVAAVPSKVTVPVGQKSVTFNIVTSGVEFNTLQTLEATAAGVSKGRVLTTTVPAPNPAALCGADDSVVVANGAGGIRTTAAGLFSCKWKKSNLTVSFMDGDAMQQDKVRMLVNLWTAATGYTFDFSFAGDTGADVVISFMADHLKMSWSRMGSCSSTQVGPVTMRLLGITSSVGISRVEQRTVLHQFGHALGLVNENQSPALEARWNAEYLYNIAPDGTPAEKLAYINREYLYRTKALNYTVFDPYSIMKAPLEAAMFTNAPELLAKYPDLLRENFDLSFMDTHFVSTWRTSGWDGYTGPEDQYLIGNWDGGTSGFGVKGDRPAVRRGNEILFSLNKDGVHDFVQKYGNHTDRWIAGDWDGDGRDTLAVIRGNCVYYDNNNDNQHDRVQCYGFHGSKYLVGDWNGDGQDNIAVVDGNCVNMDFNFDSTHDLRQCYGTVGDTYLVGDWNGDRRDNLAVLRGNCVYKDFNFDGAGDVVQCYGNAGDIYLVGDWNGDGVDNLASLRGNCLLMDHNNDGAHDEVQCYGNGPSSSWIWAADTRRHQLMDPAGFPLNRPRIQPVERDDRRIHVAPRRDVA